MSNSYDVIVVGARIAGSGMAALLARAGFRVLLVDRVRFPKTTLSSPVFFGNTLHILDRIGVSDRFEALGAPPLRHYQTRLPGIYLRGHMLPYQGRDFAYSIRREISDQLLFDHVACLTNVETRVGFNVTGLLWQSDRVVGVKGSEAGGPEESIHAELVVGADGIFSVVARETRAARYNNLPPRTCVYYAYYSNFASTPLGPAVTAYFQPTGPLAAVTAEGEGGLTVFSLILPSARFEEARHAADRAHELYGQQIPEIRDRMRGAVRETPIYGVSPRESFYRVPFGPGWALVGDAGYYKDPITGQGIHDALRSAELATDAYIRIRSGADWNRSMLIYQRTRDRETRGMYWLTDHYAHIDREIPRQEYDLFRAVSEMPHWSDRYVSLFNGVTDASSFIKRTNAFRIFWEWNGRKAWQQVSRSWARFSAAAESVTRIRRRVI